MASYKIEIRRSAEKELRHIPKPDLKRIVQKIAALADNPRPTGVQMLKGEDRYYRIRQGDWRIIYEVDDRGGTITIIKIGHRREVYE